MLDTANKLHRLTNVAHCQLGFSVRTRGMNLTQGPVRVIQARSIESGPRINFANADFIEGGEADESHYLSLNDLVIRTRGSRFDAAVVLENTMPAVAAAPLVIVRVNTSDLAPAFLAWLINHDPETRRYLADKAKGAYVPALTLGDIESMRIPVPTLSVQRTVLEASKAVARHQEILNHLIYLYEIRMNAELGQAARRNPKE